MSRWIRNRPRTRENLLAGAVAATVGGVLAAGVFYVTRLVLAREPVSEAAGLDREGEPEPPIPSLGG